MKINNHKIKALSIVMMFLMLLLAVSVPKLTAKADGVYDFIGRCYKVTLSRDADSDGYAYWRDILVNRKQDGSVVAHGFLFSPEYIDKGTSNEQYVKDLYMLFMGREPEQSGYDYWCEKMANGESREQIFAGFANSKEYFDLCFGYGITAGYYSADYGIQQVNGVNLFVERMYQTSLDRLGDQGGQNDWVQALLEGRITGIECARCFVQSPEFINKCLSDEDFLKSLYKAFMGREYDQDGLNYWLDKMNNGYTRDEVFAGFANSLEFEVICANYGIVRGNYTPTDIGSHGKNDNEYKMYEAYLNILTSNPQYNQITTDEYGLYEKSVAFSDVYGDEYPEMIYISKYINPYGYDLKEQQLNIVTFQDGQIATLVNDITFGGIYAGANNYCLFKVDDKKELYGICNYGDDNMTYEYVYFKQNLEKQTLEKHIYLYNYEVKPYNEDFYGKSQYKIEEQSVSKSKFESEKNSLLKSETDFIYSNQIDGYHDYNPFGLVQGHKNISLTYDEACEYLKWQLVNK